MCASRQQVLWRVESSPFAPRGSESEVVGVPVNDDRREKIELGGPEVLSLGRPITDLALAAGPQGALEGMVCLGLIQADPRPALHVGIEQPVDDKERPLDPSDGRFHCHS